MKPKLIVLVGIPGSGKSTEAKKKATEDWFYYSTDNYIEDVAKASGITYSEAFNDNISEATKVMDAGVVEAIKKGQDVIWDQTNLTSKKRKKILRKFEGYDKISFAFLPPDNDKDIDEIKRRLEGRPGKNIPYDIFWRMLSSFEEPTKEEGFDRVYVFNIWGELVRQSI